MDLTSDDVQEILQLLDGLPFGEMHLQTTRFSLWLRRAADGEWTQELQVLSEPAMTPAAQPPVRCNRLVTSCRAWPARMTLPPVWLGTVSSPCAATSRIMPASPPRLAAPRWW